MSKNNDFLFKQLDELYKLRKENIENIGAASNAFLTFLGLVFAGLAIFIRDWDFDKNSIDKLLVLIFAGIVVFFYGYFIRNHIWVSYINQINYTKKLNMTRGYLARGLPALRQNQILLGIDSNEPEFNKRGVTGNKTFSKDDVVCWIKWTNTIIATLVVWGVCILFFNAPCICTLFGHIAKKISIVSAFILGIIIFVKQEKDDEKFITDAKNDWKKKMHKKQFDI